MEACSRVGENMMALFSRTLRLQSKHPILQVAVLGLELLESGNQRLEVLGRHCVRRGYGRSGGRFT